MGLRMRNLATTLFVTAVAATVIALSTPQVASAISADLAKKCRDLAIKAHPPAVAGSATGSARAERDAYKACVAKGGNVQGDDTKK
jgi:hypothetical protein